MLVAKTSLGPITIKHVVDVLQRGANGFQGTQDPITAVTAAAHMLLIGRSSGDILCYTLPDLVSAGSHAHLIYFPCSDNAAAHASAEAPQAFAPAERMLCPHN